MAMRISFGARLTAAPTKSNCKRRRASVDVAKRHFATRHARNTTNVVIRSVSQSESVFASTRSSETTEARFSISPTPEITYAAMNDTKGTPTSHFAQLHQGKPRPAGKGSGK